MSKISRPPVVAIMGHIDHGKSTLLDYIRKSNVVEGEAGGITQHLSAYEIKHKQESGKVSKITFLDTPGHEAFQGIRSRGATVADIAILIVSSEDAVKPQTLEAYKWIKEGNVPFIVAITKIDKPSANVERTKQSLAENEIYVEGYGGNVPVVSVSSKTGEGVTELLDLIILLSEIEHFTGEKDRWGAGVILESSLDPKVGITAIGVIKDGTVKKGMTAASVGAIAPLRFILDFEGKQVDSLTFSSPIQLIGWDKVPPVGSVFETFDDKKAAVFYASSEDAKHLRKPRQDEISEDMTILPLIVKADAAGSLEAIIYELKKLNRERICIKIVIGNVGTVAENDVRGALTTPGTTIFAFNTKIDSQAALLAERSGVTVESFDIIYKLTERVSELLAEKEPKIEVEEVVSSVKVLKIFSITKDKHVLGARVLSGNFEKGGNVKIIRREEEIGRGKVKELQQSKMAAEVISEGNEFGALIESKIEIAPGDILDEYKLITQ